MLGLRGVNGFAEGFKTCVFFAIGAVVLTMGVPELVVVPAVPVAEEDTDVAETTTVVLLDGGVVLSDGVVDDDDGVPVDVSPVLTIGVCCWCCCGGEVLSETPGGVVCCC